jgi:hypothetical protein
MNIFLNDLWRPLASLIDKHKILVPLCQVFVSATPKKRETCLLVNRIKTICQTGPTSRNLLGILRPPQTRDACRHPSREGILLIPRARIVW